MANPNTSNILRERHLGAEMTYRHHGQALWDLVPTVALSGTAIAGGVVEAAIVTGGETLILTLTNGEWDLTIGAANALTTALIAGITGNDGGSTGWDDKVAIVAANVSRTSDTIVTITLPATSLYAILVDETISVVVPASAVPIADVAIVVQTFVVTEDP
jgi:hypothetical protein